MKCPHCQNEDETLLERVSATTWRCDVCSKAFGHVFTAKRGRLDLSDNPFDTREEKRGER